MREWKAHWLVSEFGLHFKMMPKKYIRVFSYLEVLLYPCWLTHQAVEVWKVKIVGLCASPLKLCRAWRC